MRQVDLFWERVFKEFIMKRVFSWLTWIWTFSKGIFIHASLQVELFSEKLEMPICSFVDQEMIHAYMDLSKKSVYGSQQEMIHAYIFQMKNKSLMEVCTITENLKRFLLKMKSNHLKICGGSHGALKNYSAGLLQIYAHSAGSCKEIVRSGVRIAIDEKCISLNIGVDMLPLCHGHV